MTNAQPGRGRAVMLAVVTLALLVVGAGGYLREGPADDPPRFYLPNSAGAVLFTHADHLDIVGDCETCHHESAAMDPRNCRSCHPATAAEGEPFRGCGSCHDDPDYTADFLDHAGLLEIEEHECSGCHDPVGVSDAYHALCNGCHLENDPDRFAGPGGQPLCAACHLR
ncbi:MAG: cytochrome c3 family protein [Candidatus Krumholzibacteriia bacterium]